jgi:dihydrofolate reductase
VIGRDNTIPWRIPADLARFREITMGHPVVMGRRTWDSIPARFRPLPGRRNIVVTRNPKWYGDGAEPAASLEDALRLAGDDTDVFVIGGAQIYGAALPLADELRLTEIDAEIEGDTLFPAVDGSVFEEVERELHVPEDGPPFSFVRYVRRTAAP